MDRKLKVLFLCTGNSCRSQMAEAFTRRLRGDLIEPFSAGIEKQGLNPRAVTVMAEIGLDISSGVSKTVDELEEKKFDYVITICDSAREACPFFPAGTALVHRGFDDPPALEGTEEAADDILSPYRRVRDEIREFVLTLPGSLPESR
ncbi:MAG: arsenate reductase ArsC [Candidatus Fermentibacteraceae bacterium]|nr:arsenate reductase ArsC [Candidatus Fermentibacteraceae bacterium]MBN2609446.1 arsenate reductase ArsC [Candidatus Fermentibacteraceae bacterium]